MPCGTNLTPGTLTSGAQYSASYAYDTLNRLTSGSAGSTYSYGDSAHLDAATSTSGGYTATYDASGNMLCRAPTSATTCAGSTPTGQQLTYDNEGRLTAWQNAPSAPTSTGSFLYDGEGNRVLQQSSSGGTTTTTTYVGSLEEVTTSGGTTTTTVYYPGGFAESINGVTSYLASGGLGSPEVALDANGNVEASVLYAPYGSVRSSSGSMPTDLGFTGQHSDASTTGLDYYGARSYDPTIGQFTGADTTLLGGTNRYAYVGGNPETHTDPSGHCEGDTEPDCPVAPEVRDPINDYISSTNLDCTANCDDVAHGAGTSYTDMALDTYDGVYYGPYEVGLTPEMEDASAAERGEFAQEAEAHYEHTAHEGDPNGADGANGTSGQGNGQTPSTEGTTTEANGNASSGTPSATAAYVADSNIFMDRVDPAQNAARNAILNDPNVTLYVTDSAANELSGSTTELQRLNGLPNGAQIQRIRDGMLSPGALQTLGRNFNLTDAQIVQTASDLGAPVLTMNARMEMQVLSNAARSALWPNVHFFIIP